MIINNKLLECSPPPVIWPAGDEQLFHSLSLFVSLRLLYFSFYNSLLPKLGIKSNEVVTKRRENFRLGIYWRPIFFFYSYPELISFQIFTKQFFQSVFLIRNVLNAKHNNAAFLYYWWCKIISTTDKQDQKLSSCERICSR